MHSFSNNVHRISKPRHTLKSMEWQYLNRYSSFKLCLFPRSWKSCRNEYVLMSWSWIFDIIIIHWEVKLEEWGFTAWFETGDEFNKVKTAVSIDLNQANIYMQTFQNLFCSVQAKHCHTRGHGQQMAIFLHLLHQPSIGSIRAKQITWSFSVIGWQNWG